MWEMFPIDKMMKGDSFFSFTERKKTTNLRLPVKLGKEQMLRTKK